MLDFKHMLHTSQSTFKILWSNSNHYHVIAIRVSSEVLSLQTACLSFLVSLLIYLYRGGRPRPELCSVLLGAAHVGPSLSQPHWLSEFGAEGVGDGWPSLLGQMQPLKEE